MKYFQTLEQDSRSNGEVNVHVVVACATSGSEDADMTNMCDVCRLLSHIIMISITMYMFCAAGTSMFWAGTY